MHNILHIARVYGIPQPAKAHSNESTIIYFLVFLIIPHTYFSLGENTGPAHFGPDHYYTCTKRLCGNVCGTKVHDASLQSLSFAKRCQHLSLRIKIAQYAKSSHCAEFSRKTFVEISYCEFSRFFTSMFAYASRVCIELWIFIIKIYKIFIVHLEL